MDLGPASRMGATGREKLKTHQRPSAQYSAGAFLAVLRVGGEQQN
jgi:hypothetical protein